MDKFTMDNFEALAQKGCRPCIYIFMPALRTDAEQNRIRFKNLLGRAEQMMDPLPEGYAYPAEAMEHAKRLLSDLPFWQHQSDGLALFMSDQVFETYRLPVTFEELVVVTDRFHIKPLLPFVANDARFYILAASQSRVRLFRGTRQSIQKMEPEGMPKNLSEALQYDDPEKQLQFHTGTGGSGGKRSAIFHGHGVGADDAKDRILRYFREIDRSLSPVIKQVAPDF